MKWKQIVLAVVAFLFFITVSIFTFSWFNTDQKERMLSEAAWKEEKNKVRILLALGADPNRSVSGTASAMHGAAFHGNIALIKLLIENGAEVDIETKFEITPLWWAQKNNQSKAVEFLIANGANPNTSHISPP